MWYKKKLGLDNTSMTRERNIDRRNYTSYCMKIHWQLAIQLKRRNPSSDSILKFFYFVRKVCKAKPTHRRHRWLCSIYKYPSRTLLNTRNIKNFRDFSTFSIDLNKYFKILRKEKPLPRFHTRYKSITKLIRTF